MELKLPSLATECVILGHYRRADVVWTKPEFMAVCRHMMNGNPSNHFLQAYRDGVTNNAKFTKAKSDHFWKRANWAWDTILERAKVPTGIGFYPMNSDRMSTWSAMDFDAHDGNSERARTLAYSAFQLLRAHQQLFLALATSGSDGWHLFLFSRELHPVEEWTLLLKQVADMIGTKIQRGICEIFPNESKGAVGYGIRAPGTWNPKHDALGLIAFQNLTPNLVLKEKKRKCPFLYQETISVNDAEFPDSETKARFSALLAQWDRQFAIVQVNTRHENLKALVVHLYRQIGYGVAKWQAEKQYDEATVPMKASRTEHLVEFEQIWNWIDGNWLSELSSIEREKFNALETQNQRDVFRIAHSFAKLAKAEGRNAFAFVRENMALRIGITPPGVAKIREKLAGARVFEMTAEFVPNKSSKQYRWIADIDVPF